MHAASLLFVHGFTGKGVDWFTMQERFKTSRVTCTANLPGHSRRPIPENMRFQDAADSLCITLPPAVVVGYSMGGRLALAAALRRPGEVAGLVLESASPGLAAEAERETRRSLDRERADRLRELGTEDFLREWYQQPLFASLAEHPGRVEELIFFHLDHEPQKLAQALVALSVANQPDFRPQLSELQVPVLCIAGERDARYAALAVEMAEAVPRGEARIIPEAGHNVHLEQPEAFGQALEEFLERNEL